MTTVDETPVQVRKSGHAGVLVLNRPRALNALNLPMIRLIDEALTEWETDEEVAHVVVTGAGERGLCAGGDVRAFHADAVSGDHRASTTFWRAEYRLNARIARYAKPYVALMDGIVMGGGVGISAHGSHRVVTERSRIAMPETGIGFVPDVGGTHLLSRAPGELGTHLGLTGLPMDAGEAVHCGFADHLVPSEALPSLLDDLASLPAADAVSRHSESPPASALAGEREWIDDCYAAGSVEEIAARLRRRADTGNKAAEDALTTLLCRSPNAVKTTLVALRRARATDHVETTLEREFGVSRALLDTADLAEGVRAQVIDKDRSPKWSPPALENVPVSDVARFFVPVEGEGLGLRRR